MLVTEIVKYAGPVKMNFSALTGAGIKLGIVDSGICGQKYSFIKGISISDSGKLNAESPDLNDYIGHGTACAGLIKAVAPQCELYIAKVFHQELKSFPKAIAAAIAWMINERIDIINISLGTANKSHSDTLKEAILEANTHGIIVVSANCNMPGKVAYPAAFDTVIGVEAGLCKTARDFYYCKGNGAINVIAKGDRQLLEWSDGKRIYMGGTSFACANMSGIIALIKQDFPAISINELKLILKENSLDDDPGLIHDDSIASLGKRSTSFAPAEHEPPVFIETHSRRFVREIKKAVIYPYNKEMHGLIRFRDMLSFKIAGVVDFIGNRNVGKDAAELIGLPSCGLRIEANLKIALEKADTLILGYVDQLERLTRKAIFEECIRTAFSMGKKIYSLVPFSNDGRSGINELIDKNIDRFAVPIIEKNYFEALAANYPPDILSEKPVIGILGTSPRQGKFTLQMTLRNEMVKRGYGMGLVSTEHQGELFGAHAIYPIGYSGHTNVLIPMDQHIAYLRSAIRMIEATGADATICAGQSGIIPHDYAEFNPVYTLPSIITLMGILPDAIVLVVNTVDENEFVHQCIKTSEAISKAKVISLAFSTLKKIERRTPGRSVVLSLPMDEDEITQTRQRLVLQRKLFNSSEFHQSPFTM